MWRCRWLDFLDEQRRTASLVTCADAARHFPRRELTETIAALARRTGFPSPYTDEQMNVLLVRNRLCNPICSGCGKKDHAALSVMRPCAGCMLVFYCDAACAQRDWEGGTGMTRSEGGHRAQCVAGDGGRSVLYRGPLEVALLKRVT